MKKLYAMLAAVPALALPLVAQAQVDVTPVVDAIEGHTANLVLIGAAVIGVVYAVRVFSWARKI